MRAPRGKHAAPRPPLLTGRRITIVVVTTIVTVTALLVGYVVTDRPRQAAAVELCADLRDAHLDVALLQQADVPVTDIDRQERQFVIQAVAGEYDKVAAADAVPEQVKKSIYVVSSAVNRAAEALDDPATAEKSNGYLKAALPTSMLLRRWCVPYTPPV